MPKQSVNVRLTPKANKILVQWKKRYGGRNKSETIQNTEARLGYLGIELGTEEEEN